MASLIAALWAARAQIAAALRDLKTRMMLRRAEKS